MGYVFISYSRKDKEFVISLVNSFERPEISIPHWVDFKHIEPGARWSDTIYEALKNADCLIVVLSQDAMDSIEVSNEWNYALDCGIHVVPILFHQCHVHYRLKQLQYIDFSRGISDNDLQKLTKAINEYLRPHRDRPSWNAGDDLLKPLRNPALHWREWIDNSRFMLPYVARHYRDNLGPSDEFEVLQAVFDKAEQDFKEAGTKLRNYYRPADLKAKSLVLLLAYMLPESAGKWSKQELNEDASFSITKMEESWRKMPKPWITYFSLAEKRTPGDFYTFFLQALQHTMFTQDAKYEYHGDRFILTPPPQAIEYIWSRDSDPFTHVACVSIALMCLNAAHRSSDKDLQDCWATVLRKWQKSLRRTTQRGKDAWLRYSAMATHELITTYSPLLKEEISDFVYIPPIADLMLRYRIGQCQPPVEDRYFIDFFDLISANKPLIATLIGIQLMRPLTKADIRWESNDEVVAEFLLQPQHKKRLELFANYEEQLARFSLAHQYRLCELGKSTVDPKDIEGIADGLGMTKNELIDLKNDLNNQFIEKLMDDHIKAWVSRRNIGK